MPDIIATVFQRVVFKEKIGILLASQCGSPPDSNGSFLSDGSIQKGMDSFCQVWETILYQPPVSSVEEAGYHTGEEHRLGGQMDMGLSPCSATDLLYALGQFI